VHEDFSFTKRRIMVRGKARRADFILHHQLNLPLAVIEAKDNTHSIGAGMQQALDGPIVFSSNGDGFLLHDRTGTGTQVETELNLDQFPSPQPTKPKCQHTVERLKSAFRLAGKEGWR